jgi:hypothetical protein
MNAALIECHALSNTEEKKPHFYSIGLDPQFAVVA